VWIKDLSAFFLCPNPSRENIRTAMKKFYVLLAYAFVATACAPDNRSDREPVAWPDPLDRFDGMTDEECDAVAVSLWDECAEYHYQLGYRYWEEKDAPAQACIWLRKAAEMGHADAQLLLGDMLLTGIGGKSDVQEALYWIHKAAEQGQVEAQCELASCYYFGKIVERSEAKCVYWLSKAEEHGSEWAKKRLEKLGVTTR